MAERALVPARSADSDSAGGDLVVASEPRFAESLDKAQVNSLVYVGAKGQVQPVQRSRARVGLLYGILGASLGGLMLMGATSMGIPGLLFAGFFGLFQVGMLAEFHRLKRGLVLLASDDVEGCEKICRSVLRSPLASRQSKAQALGLLARAAAFRGDYETSLELTEQGMARCGWWSRGSVHVQMLAFGRVHVLIELGRLAEARSMLEELGPEPEGDYLRLLHRTSTLYLAFASGLHEVDEDTLHAWSTEALRVLPSVGLLALTGWAYRMRGDDELADHLLTEALKRWVPPASRSMRRLDAWLRAESVRMKTRPDPYDRLAAQGPAAPDGGRDGEVDAGDTEPSREAGAPKAAPSLDEALAGLM